MLLLRLRLVLLLLQLLLLLFFLRQVMPDGATGCSAQHRMMAGDVSRHGAYRSTFDAALR